MNVFLNTQTNFASILANMSKSLVLDGITLKCRGITDYMDMYSGRLAHQATDDGSRTFF